MTTAESMADDWPSEGLFGQQNTWRILVLFVVQ